ncbi:MAG: 5-formyltetrahydrofolate cyclo-ligase [Bacteroidota bacterium]
MTKAFLRKTYAARRQALNEDSYQQQSRQIQQRFLQAFNLTDYSYVHIYLAVVDRREVATRGIVHTLFSQYPEVVVAAPRLVGKPERIASRIITPETTFQAHQWGLQEPTDGKAIIATDFDMVILPVIAFDAQGYRVGYGKGHYDRFLAQCRPTVTKVGLCFEDSVPAITDLHAYDVPMDYCITPRQVWRRNTTIE